jgi:integration host factor subunit alpha
MAVTKKDIVESVAEEVGITKTQASEAFDMVFETMVTTLERGEQVKISGFGSFNPKDKKAREGRNPSTGKPIEISARRVVTFKASAVLKDRMND